MSQNPGKTRLQVLKDRAKASSLVTYDGGTEAEANWDSKDGLPRIIKVNYTSVPVVVPSDFLAPLPDPDNTISVQMIDWIKVQMPENRDRFAVILDNVLDEDECKQLIHLAEKSAGAHRGEKSSPDNGWRPAMVNAGRNKEFLDTSYRNSDRIIWDNQEVAKRIWKRVMQGKGITEYFSALEGIQYKQAIGYAAYKNNERWVISENGSNERMRFLKYGAGQFFRPHCDSYYETPDGMYRTFYTMHVYLNDSVQALNGGIINLDVEEDSPDAMLEGGATRFHSISPSGPFYDADPKVGRVLVFQHRNLLHSGDDVTRGVKYTMRSDIMYRLDDTASEDGSIVFEE